MTAVELLTKLQEKEIQLWAEEDKLKFSAPKGALTPDLRSELVEHKAELIELLHGLTQSQEQTPEILRTPRAENGPTTIPASYPQQRLWFLEQLDPGKATFNLPLALALNGRLNTTALQQSLNQLVTRHETLRTTFTEEDGVPVQVIQPSLTVPLALVDLQYLPALEREAEAERQIHAAANQPFNLVEGPLLRTSLFRLHETSHYLLIALHHIVSDGWSEGVMLRELTELYQAAAEDRPSTLPELQVQYGDFSEWQHGWLQSEEAAGQLAYWEKQLAGLPPLLELPTDFPRPNEPSGQGGQLRVTLPPGLTEAVNRLSRDEGATPYMTLLAAFKLLLYRYSGQEDFAVGTSIANRTHAEIEPLIGFFLNTLVLRTDLSGNPTFRELLGRVRDVTLNAFAHQQIPVDKLVERLQPARNTAYSPLFQV